MDKRLIDMGTYRRRDHFNYFGSMAYPYVGATVNVDITAFLKATKVSGRPFFLSLLYEVSRAANEVPEFRQRIEDGDIAEYAFCPTSHTVAREDGTYAYCELRADMPIEAFLPYAAEKQEQARQEGGIREEEVSPLLFVSCLPWLEYTALVQPVPLPADSNPRITWGKYFERDGRTLLPMTVLVNHALVDGKHISDFYGELTKKLNRI